MNDQILVFINKNQDMFICPILPIKGNQSQTQLKQIGTKVDSALWNDRFNVLISIADSNMVIYYIPDAIFIDRELFEMAKETKDASEFGISGRITSFTGTTIILERSCDRASLSKMIIPFINPLYNALDKNKWKKALKLCRFVEIPQLWATLAVVALRHRELEVVQTSLAAINMVDKFQHIKRIRAIKDKEVMGIIIDIMSCNFNMREMSSIISP